MSFAFCLVFIGQWTKLFALPSYVYERVLIAENQKDLVVFMIANLLQTQKGLVLCLKV